MMGVIDPFPEYHKISDKFPDIFRNRIKSMAEPANGIGKQLNLGISRHVDLGVSRHLDRLPKPRSRGPGIIGFHWTWAFGGLWKAKADILKPKAN